MSAIIGMACKDAVANSVRQLLELDEHKQRAMLDSLSKYADKKDRDKQCNTGIVSLSAPPGLEREIPSTYATKCSPVGSTTMPGWISGAHSDAARVPNMPYEPFAIQAELQFAASAAMTGGNLGVACKKLEHAADALNVALVQWLAFLPAHTANGLVEDVTCAEPTATPCLPYGVREPFAGVVGYDTTGGLKAQAQRSVMVEKAVSDLITSLPPSATMEAHHVLSGVMMNAGQLPKAQLHKEQLEALKWITQHLEQRQQASMQKLQKLLSTKQAEETPTEGQQGLPSVGDEALVRTDRETLRVHLESLLQVDAARIVVVRKINRLGFASPLLLEEHGSRFGTIERALVAHCHLRFSRSQGKGMASSRLRPASMGFLVFSLAEDAKAMLKAGFEQNVGGIVIHVHAFERHRKERGDMDDLEDVETQAPGDGSSEETQSS